MPRLRSRPPSNPSAPGAARLDLVRQLDRPPNSSSFSVKVVLPASGCEMIAKVRRRAKNWPLFFCHHERVVRITKSPGGRIPETRRRWRVVDGSARSLVRHIRCVTGYI